VIGDTGRLFSDFRLLHGEVAGRWPLVLLDLEHDPRMVEAWASFNRHRTNDNVFHVVLNAILRLKSALAHNKKITVALELARADRERLLAASAELLKFLADVSQGTNFDAPLMSRHIAKLALQAKEHLRDVARATTFITRSLDETERRLELIVNTSQKRLTQHVHFSNLLCRVLQRRVGQPLHSFVATTTSVVYELQDDYSPASVRMAYDRDRRRRDKAKLAKRTVLADK